MEDWGSISSFIESELTSSSCYSKNPASGSCVLSEPCHLRQSSIEENFKIFGLPVSPAAERIRSSLKTLNSEPLIRFVDEILSFLSEPLPLFPVQYTDLDANSGRFLPEQDQPCVGVYPTLNAPLDVLQHSYHTTLDSLYPQQLITIVLLSQLMTSAQNRFTPVQQIFRAPQYKGLDRTHLLVNPYESSWQNLNSTTVSSKSKSCLQPSEGCSSWKQSKTEGIGMEDDISTDSFCHLELFDLTNELAELQSSNFTSRNLQLSNLALLSSYASYNLKCSSFFAIETGMVASQALSNKMRSLTHEGRTNLAAHLQQSSWASRDELKVLLPVYRLSRITGSHLLMLNLDERRNYVSKFAQTASKFHSTTNLTTAEFFQLFAHLQSATVPMFILPSLVTPSVDLKRDLGNSADLDLHPDIELEKSVSPTALNVTIKATYTQVSQDGEYASSFIFQPRGYFQTKEVYPRDTFTILFSTAHRVSHLSVISGSPNQPDKKIKSGHVSVSNLGSVNSKSGQVMCSKTRRLGSFSNGSLYFSQYGPLVVKCLVIYFGNHQPNGVILYHIQLVA